MKNKFKIYLKPCSFVGKDQGILLEKRNMAKRLCGTENFFTKIQVITREESSEIKFIPIKEFEKDFLINKEVKSSYSKLLSERKVFFNDKNLMKKKDFLIFGILNVTPDSFSDGGQYLDSKRAIEKAQQMFHDGAAFIDVGGESTRPGARKISSNDELLRILPIIQGLSLKNIPISLDSRNYSTMEMSSYFQIAVFNDVSALKNNKNKISLIKNTGSMTILMHMPGTPKTMMKRNKYRNVVLDVYDYLDKRIDYCEKLGLSRDKIIIDPGIGFGKDTLQNIELLKHISVFHSLGCPIMLGISRKSLISKFGKSSTPKERLPGSIAIQLKALSEGIQIFRVHDVKETIQAFTAWKSTY